MKKTTFNISFDEDKAAALVLYLSQKGATVETELEKHSIRSIPRPSRQVCVILST